MKKIFLTTAFMLMASIASQAEDKKMNAFIDQLMAKMTVEEKLGQMNLMPGSSVTTGEDPYLGSRIAEAMVKENLATLR